MPILYCSVMISLHDLYNLRLSRGIGEWPELQRIGLCTAPDFIRRCTVRTRPSGYTPGYLTCKRSSNSREVRQGYASAADLGRRSLERATPGIFLLRALPVPPAKIKVFSEALKPRIGTPAHWDS
jgi:hypothetical protein